MDPEPPTSRQPEMVRSLAALRRLLKAILPSNQFYREKFRRAGIATEIASMEDFARRFPLTTKAELVHDHREHPPYGSNLTFPVVNYVRFHQTSGSTGYPLRWLDTAESWQWIVDNWKAVLRAAGVGRGDRVFFAFSFGPFLGFWSAFEAAAQLGSLCLPGGGMTSSARMQAILENEVNVLCCTPTYAGRLAEVARHERLPWERSRVRTIVVAGEPGGSIPATRRRLSALWNGARVFDHHGMTEVGPVTHECPERPGSLEIIGSAFIAEILDPQSLHPVPTGETGELVLTTLGRYACPLIRYRTGDLVRAAPRSEVSPRPENLILEGGILGRADDMVIIRGVNVFPSAVEAMLRKYPEIIEYRVAINTTGTLNQMRLEIEPDPNLKDIADLVRRVGLDFQSSMNLRIPVAAVEPGDLPRFEMKARRWIREAE